MQVGIVFVPQVAKVFELVSLNTVQWFYVATISVAPVAIMELQKKLNEIIFGKVVYKYKEARKMG